MEGQAPARTSLNSCGCGDVAPRNYYIIAKGSDGREHALFVDQGRVLLAEDNRATMILIGQAKPGVLALGLEPELAIEVVNGTPQVTKGTKTPFVVERVPGNDDLYRLHTNERQYLCAPDPGKPIRLSSEAGAGTALRFTPAIGATPAVAPAPTAFKNRRPNVYSFDPKDFEDFAAEPGAWDTETLSTHLWIFNRAKRLILNNKITTQNGLGQNQDALRYFLRDEAFVQAAQKGIDAADNTGMFDKDTSGLIYSAHFYNVKLNKGGWWDPNPAINALEYGKRYFHDSVAQGTSEASGRSLGLAIHYLQDLCQPMHCGLYPNQPGDSAYGFKHDNYEKWILSIQSSCELLPHELGLDDFNFADIGGWWVYAASHGLAEYEAWEKEGIYGSSPISHTAFGSERLSVERAAHARHDNWVTAVSRMLKLAQRLTAGLLLAWADAPAKMVSDIKTTYKPDELLIVDLLHQRCVVAGDAADGNIYHQSSEGRANARWILERVLTNGNPAIHVEGGKQYPVFYIRDRKHNKYIVAGDTADNNVYHQPHNGRLNAQWTLEPVTGPDGTPYVWEITHPYDMYHPDIPTDVYPVYHIKDMKHRLCLVAGDHADNHVYHQPENGRLNAKWGIDSNLKY